MNRVNRFLLAAAIGVCAVTLVVLTTLTGTIRRRRFHRRLTKGLRTHHLRERLFHGTDSSAAHVQEHVARPEPPSRMVAYYINIAAETRRRDHMQRFFQNAEFPFPVHRFEASTPDNLRILTKELAPTPEFYGRIACYDSHLRLMIQFLEHPDQPDVLLVFEDDIEWNDGVNPQDFFQALRAFSASDAEAMWFGAWNYGLWYRRRTEVPGMPRDLAITSATGVCLHATAIRRSAVQAFVAALEQDISYLQEAVDDALVRFMQGRRVLAIAEPLSADRKFRGLIRQRREDFPTSIPTSGR